MVTGGGSGLGREFCRILAEFGADIACPDLRKERAEETCEEIVRGLDRRALPLEADLSKPDQVQAAFKKVEETFGRLDILVNNAGMLSVPSVIHEMSVENWHRVMDVNLHGVFYCMKEGLGMMMKQQRGSIINISSVVGMNGLDPDIDAVAHYGVSKTGVIGLTRQGAAEYGKYNVRVNCIAPGWFLGTRLVADSGRGIRSPEASKARMEQLAAKTPMRRTGDPKELQGLMLYLASDASSYVTGQIIAVDGGFTCWRC